MMRSVSLLNNCGSSKVAFLTTVLLITVVYVYFLIFAQFAFLELAKLHFEMERGLHFVMAPMGIAGFFVSVLVAVGLRKIAPRTMLRWGLLLSGFNALATALIAIKDLGIYSYALLAALIGMSLAIATVSLATGLREFAANNNIGFQVGLGTGIAYWVCNAPFFFQASSLVQTIVSGVLCCIVGLLLFIPANDYLAESNRKLAEHMAVQVPNFIPVLLSFFALVWLDSSAFFVIQQTTGLKLATWGDPQQLWLNGAMHLIMAITAGVLLDRGKFRFVIIAAFLFLTAGVLVLNISVSFGVISAVLYVSGVSLYSTALVVFPSLCGHLSEKVSIRWRAGLVYGIAGWIGSAMGIGMAEDLQRVPVWFLVVAGFVVVGCMIRKRNLVATAMILLFFGVLPENSVAQPSVARGRAVYIQEGCMHCHSQYIRPGSIDVEEWGASKDPKELLQQEPPLIGNRRQAPDLLSIGSRRSAEWQRIHLKNPRIISHGSTMPSYRHLFRDTRGEDLIAYLQSLQTETLEELYARINAWNIDVAIQPVGVKVRQQLYSGSCAPCHGELGGPKGPLNNQLSVSARDLLKDLFRFTKEDDVQGLARIVKFGIPGTSMPGHEYFSSEEILGIVFYIQEHRARAH